MLECASIFNLKVPCGLFWPLVVQATKCSNVPAKGREEEDLLAHMDVNNAGRANVLRVKKYVQDVL